MSEENEITTKGMLDALNKAGKEVAKTATDEEIEVAYVQLQQEQESKKEAEAPKPEPTKKTAKKKLSKEEQFQEVLANADRNKGDKDPAVIAWCRENLTKKEFEDRYEGRNIPPA